MLTKDRWVEYVAIAKIHMDQIIMVLDFFII